MGLYTVRLLGRADRVADGKGIVARTLNTLSAGRSMGGAPAGEHLVLMNTLMVAPARSGSTPAAFSATTRFRSSGAAVRLGAGGGNRSPRGCPAGRNPYGRKSLWRRSASNRLVRQPLSRSEALLEATRRVTALRGGDDLGALNLYSRSPNASPDGSEQVGPVVSIAASRARRPKPRAVAPALVLDRRTYRPHRPGARDLCSGCTQRLRIHALLGESIREHHRGPGPPCTLARDGRVLVARGRAALLWPEAEPRVSLANRLHTTCRTDGDFLSLEVGSVRAREVSNRRPGAWSGNLPQSR